MPRHLLRRTTAERICQVSGVANLLGRLRDGVEGLKDSIDENPSDLSSFDNREPLEVIVDRLLFEFGAFPHDEAVHDEQVSIRRINQGLLITSLSSFLVGPASLHRIPGESALKVLWTQARVWFRGLGQKRKRFILMLGIKGLDVLQSTNATSLADIVFHHIGGRSRIHKVLVEILEICEHRGEYLLPDRLVLEMGRGPAAMLLSIHTLKERPKSVHVFSCSLGKR
jgi:hypothetical protein